MTAKGFEPMTLSLWMKSQPFKERMKHDMN